MKKVNKKDVKKVNNKKTIINEKENVKSEKYFSNVIAEENFIDLKTGKLLSHVEYVKEENQTPVVEEDKTKEINDFENFTKEELIEKLKKAEEEKSKLKTKKPERGVKKRCQMFDLLSRPEGVTIEEMMKEFGWQKHSVRGVMSTLQKDYQFQLIKLETSVPSSENDGKFIKNAVYFAREIDCKPLIVCEIIDETKTEEVKEN